MSRRPPEPRLCAQQCGRPVRQRRGAAYCSPCVSKIPKRDCAECGHPFFPDMMAGTRCKQCASGKAHEKRVGETFGLQPGQYAALLAAQGGRCFICHRKPVSKRLAVDHDHSCCPGPTSCGRCVRGLLCKHDNFYLIGGAEKTGEAIAYLERALEYLKNPPAKGVLGHDGPTG